ncbi:MAG: 2-oxoglutarate dehydrogenase complex dihydrolipoyllysine-residue succinyltransferase [Phycisphaerales bacterium]|nr:2-oxoglutarate dehydrogenase complex dihydrolipoyllysine-residue succinyltransferase [Phycisphaerales bacterium]
MTTKIEIPTVGESVTSGVISAWSVADGEYVERDQTVLELETDKVTMEVPAPASGVVSHSAAEGDEVEVGAVVGQIDESAEKPAGGGAAPAPSESAPAAEAKPEPAASAAATAVAEAPKPAPAPAPASTSASGGDVKATPLARKLAEDKGVNLALVTGTGAGGRIREQDVLGFVQSGASKAPSAAPAAVGGSREVVVERMSPMRQKIASRLVEAQQTAAMLTTFNEVDMGAVMDLRKQYKESFADKHGVGLGFMSFFVKACVQALQKFPLINSYITAGEDGKPAIQSHSYQDIAIAVAGKKGLVVPVLRNTETMSFAGIESSIKDLGTRARENKLELSEMMGGTFTITNGGIFGSLMSTPILNPPQSAILGMHGIKKRAVEDPNNPGQIALRPMMYLALSYDHRIVDGAEAVQFLVSIKDAIEDPARLMLDL